MYKRNAQGWSKHFDFFLIDILVLQVSFILAVYMRTGDWAYDIPIYKTMGLLFVLSDALVIVLNNSMHNVVTRGYYREAVQTLKHCFLLFALAAVAMFVSQSGSDYSRIALTLTAVFHCFLGYFSRLLWKTAVKRRSRNKKNKVRMLVVSSSDAAEGILKRLSGQEVLGYCIIGVILTDKTNQTEVCGFPIVSNIDNAADYIVREWVDSVYIHAPLSDQTVIKLMDDCTLMGVPTHYHVPSMSQNDVKRFSEKIGGTTVLTTSINYATPAQMIMKRFFDIVAGIIGSIIAILIIIIVGPIIKLKSPGPILFSQIRVGKNGKKFKLYKIRSMHRNAEEQKAELAKQNRVKDGMMFKLDFDPRIIGNRVLPDGTKKTGIGEFIRRTSLDEFPQFFCVLKGDMSTIGTRPPTVDEYVKYNYHHRARLAIKPGITGLWQVSGRSEITDFEEVVKLDSEYILNWSPAMDIRILFKTIKTVFSNRGAL